MKLSILGYYGGYPANGVGTSGYLLQSGDYNLMVDAGSGTLLALQKVLDPMQLDALLLTHYHHDHIADVGPLQYEWQLVTGARKEAILPIYGHTEDPLNFAALTWPNATQGIGYDPDSSLVLGPFVVTFMRTVHPVPTFAVKVVETKTRQTLVFTADSALMPTLATFAKDADVLMVDTNFYDDHVGKEWHMEAGQAGTLAKEAKAKTLILTHLPQTGDLQRLKQEAAAKVTKDTRVLLASEINKLEI
ncbi:MBL fold metallo-hydrolase [Furfurilactobacillus siliginis]|uniref:Beta-lactamase superfamily hydrolase n=1 Tax=Furfurilactobacillus siliginis TaxID=348151 RepID=A0A0R2LBQ6_9LACO|nr:MBL fold metallo-hydrolase [Furfurilactobacillus siliginis]KRN96093.1 beta-lactamase superfamily hydrolase [Furfurilactobacillus siliginis]GEK27983.1 MBL fold metallo-hydrolase [Furfurilactobacillus siliginis]